MLLFLLKVGGWVKSKAWPWLKKYWMWVLLPPIALVSYLWGKKRGTVVVAPDRQESDAAQELKRRVEQEKAQALDAAARERVERIEAVLEEHVDTVSQLSATQKDQATVLLQNPDALNAYLLSIGKRVRDG